MNSSQNNKNKRTTTCSILLTMLVASSIITVPYLYRWWTAANSTFSIQTIDFKLKPDGRYTTIKLKATGSQPIDVTSIQFDGTKTSTFTITKSPLGSEETIQITVRYPWQSQKSYTIRVETKQGSYREAQAETPRIETSLDFSIINASRSPLKEDGTYQITLEYDLNSTGYEWTYIGFYLYKSYQQSNLPIYIFYDAAYMPNQTLRRAETFSVLASKHGLNVSRISWEGLKTLAIYRPKSILVLFNPLISTTGKKYYNAAPSCLMDPNEDGFVKNHSAYLKSIVYDWEKDNNLIFITVGSSQAPAEWIIAKNGTAYKPRDTDFTDKFFADTSGAFRGMGYDVINTTRIGRTLGLHSWGSGWRLDPSLLDVSIGPENYYVYGLNNLGWSQPVYIKVGTGGWLYCGDGWNLDDSTIVHDLIMMILHSPWNGELLGSNGWNYDNGYKLYLTNRGAYVGRDGIQTGYIHGLKTTNMTLRSLLISYDVEKDSYLVYNEVKEYQKWWTEYGISLEAAQSILKSDGRYIDFMIRAMNQQSVDIKDICLNGSKTPSWTGRRHLEPGVSVNISLRFPWLGGKTYVLKVETEQGSFDETVIQTPNINLSVDLDVTRIIKERSLNESRLTFNYNINITGYESLYTSFFIYKSYNDTDKKIYVFYDPNYMPNTTLRRIDAFLNIAKEYKLDAMRLDWHALRELARYRPNCTLILFNPLMNSSNHLFYDAIPSSLLDADEDGYVKTESVYNKSSIYDWERDRGLIFISLGSDQAPSRWIIAENGTAYKPRDTDFTDKFFADTSGAFRGMGYISITPTRAGQTLALHNWGGWWMLDATALGANLTHGDYYIYGFGANTGYAQPIYIKVGKGGWLHCGSGWNLGDDAVAHDLAMLLLHAPWNGKWLGAEPWNYDSASKLYIMGGGKMGIEDTFSTGWMKEDVENFLLRIIFTAYDKDRGRYIIWER